MTEKHKVIFIIGGPGSGKGTACEHLIEKYGLSHFSTGDLLRQEMKNQTKIGLEITDIMNRGDLVPGDVSVRLLKENIMSLKTDQISLIDGFPRNEDNVHWWQEEAAAYIDVLGVIYLDCEVETMKKRILGRNQGRSDDNEEVFTHRIEIFQ